MKKYVSYFRVSTAKQGVSGLGLEAQQESVRRFLNGGQWTMVGEFIEVESGKRNDRPQLAHALALCRRHRATLIIGKLDRLGRNVHFISGLMESGVAFLAVDMPEANKLTLHIMAAFAEHEAGLISQRTKDALGAARARGVVLGGNRGKLAVARVAGALVRTAKAQRLKADLRPILEAERAAVGQSGGLRAIAARLNERGIPAPSGGNWHPTSILRIMSDSQPG
jgi:DNA invertase Pin-like site-specific DNA recombinase